VIATMGGCRLGGERRDRGVSRWSGRALASLLASRWRASSSSRLGRSDPDRIEVTASQPCISYTHTNCALARPERGKKAGGTR
jgi:hypothetical protein